VSRIKGQLWFKPMARRFKTADYPAMLKQTVSIEDCIPPSHLARFIVSMIGELDLSAIYAAYGAKGGIAIAPEILLGLLFYGYATGVFSSRAIERATHESIPFRFIAGNLHPDHDTIAAFRRRFLVEIQALFVQVLERAVAAKILQIEDISLDGTKIHADASKSQAVSHKRLGEIQAQLQLEVNALLQLGQQADGVVEPIEVAAEVARRQAKLADLSVAQTVLHGRAQARYELEQAAYDEKMSAREAYTTRTGRRARGPLPTSPFLRSVTPTNTISLTPNPGS
jgi:transposase